MSEQNNDEMKRGWKLFFKILTIIAVVLVLMAVIGLGLIVGACATPPRR